MGVRGAKRADWLVWKGEVTTTWCPQWYGRQTWSHKRKKGTEEEQASLSNSINRTTLAQRCEKNSSQNIVLPSWTFNAAASCFCCTRQTKIKKKRTEKNHANHHNPSIFRDKRSTTHGYHRDSGSQQLRNDHLYSCNLGTNAQTTWKMFFLTDSFSLTASMFTKFINLKPRKVSQNGCRYDELIVLFPLKWIIMKWR